jgi:acetylornithine/N-succinyldiaminopimelate aminotransferase
MKLFNVYPLFDIEPVKALGASIWDTKGEKYLDLYGGHAVISIGHSHPYYVQKLSEQLQKIGFYSNSVQIPQQVALAEKLGKLSGLEDYALFLCNSGAEANENALKLASFYTHQKKVVCFSQSFHGRTSGAVEITDNPSIKAPFNQNKNAIFLPFNDIQAVKDTLQQNKDVAAVIIEGIQGVGGIQVPTKAFLQELRSLCDAFGIVLILDEVQSGYGRTGKFFAYQHSGIQADLVSVAKGMGNGFPIGGLLIHPKFEAKFGMLGTTFGGNHLACVAGIAVLDVLKEENLMENATQLGNYWKAEFAKLGFIKEIRGEGLMLGLEFDFPIKEMRNKLLFEHKIFTGYSGTNVIRLLPPMSLKKEEADIFLNALKSVNLP